MRFRFIILMLFLVMGIGFCAGVSCWKRPIELISGVAKSQGSRERYDKTLLYSYPNETEWVFVDNTDNISPLDIVGAAGVLADIDSGEILFEKNATERLPVASLVKIMTAVIALEHAPLDRKITISADSAGVGENSMQVSVGEVYTLEELLYGLILHSGNDAAYAIAESVAGSSDTFVEWMNFKASELGLKDTYFADPCGLDDSSYSTPLDLAKLTRYALKNPEFREIAKTVEKEIYSDTYKYVYLYNQTNLLTTYPGVAGVKTGFTEEAGLCLVTYANNEGVELVGVVLDSIDRKGDMILMLDYGFETLGVPIEHSLW